jgi:riboflavin synthase
MFTGIVQAVGRVLALQPRGGDVRLSIDTTTLDLGDVVIGDSIAVAGTCLTVVEIGQRHFAADVTTETLTCTSLGALSSGAGVNLEKSLRLADRLGGHLASGHVDGIGTVADVRDDGRAQRWLFVARRDLLRYVAAKGSICVDGVSLTVNGVDADGFHVALIPHTVAVTTFAERHVGDKVNLEVDLVARYVERLMRSDGA